MPPSSATAYQSLQDFSKNMIDPTTALNQGQSQYGVQGLGGQVSALRTLTGNLQNSITNVDPSVTGRTQGGLVTEAQRQAIVNKERSPLVDQFNTTSGNLNNLNDQYSTAQNLASQYANALITGQTNKLSALDAQYKDALASEAAIEQKRQFDVQAAAAAKAASANSGLDLRALLGDKKPPAAPAGPDYAHFANDPNPYNWYNFLTDANKTFFSGKASYGQLADWAQKAVGSNIGNGSAGDLALRNIFLHTALDPNANKSSSPKQTISGIPTSLRAF